MTVSDWELLTTLYEEKNITKAAAKLYISQPAVTKRLKMIEKEFEVQIVDRGHKGVIFTPEGDYLVKYSHEMLDRYYEAKRTLTFMNYSDRGTIKIGVSNTFARKVLPTILAEYQKEFPDVKFDVVTGWSHEIFKLLCEKKIQVGFVRGGYKWANKSELLFDESLYVINSEEIKLEELPFKHRIEYSCEEKLRALIDNWWRENFDENSENIMTVDRSDTCKRMVKEGLGYSIISKFVLNSDDDFYKIELKTKSGEAIKRRTQMFYYDEFLESNIGKKFVELVKDIDYLELIEK